MDVFKDFFTTTPNTAKMFFREMMLSYGMSFDTFNNFGMHHKMNKVLRFFGYSMISDISMLEDEMIKKIKFIFEDYEDLFIRYPQGVPDKLKILFEMSNKEKDKFVDEYFKSEVRISLCHAICQISHFERPSLKDAIKPRELSALDKIVAENAAVREKEGIFWEKIKKEFNKELVAPF